MQPVIHTTIVILTGLFLLVSLRVSLFGLQNLKPTLTCFAILIASLSCVALWNELVGSPSAPPSSGTTPAANVLPGLRLVLIENTSYVCTPLRETDQFSNSLPT